MIPARFRGDAFTPKLVTTLREGYRAGDLRADALAGLTVAIVALPLAMALGIASGASPREGLLTAIIAGFLISALGGSRVQIGGPTGAFVVIVAGVIATHGFDGLVLATLLAGVILIVAGYAGVGRMMRYVPMPVVTGFTAGIAVIIASSQIGDFLGPRTGPVPADFIDKWGTYGRAIGTANLAALGLGAATLMAIIVVRRFAPRAPAPVRAPPAAAVVVCALHQWRAAPLLFAASGPHAKPTRWRADCDAGRGIPPARFPQPGRDRAKSDRPS